MTFAGSCNRDLVEMWLEECLVPQLQPGDVIVIDNASFHHSQTIEEIVAQAGCEIWYLPPYSPDLNDKALGKCNLWILKALRDRACGNFKGKGDGLYRARTERRFRATGGCSQPLNQQFA